MPMSFIVSPRSMPGCCLATVFLPMKWTSSFIDLAMAKSLGLLRASLTKPLRSAE